MTAAHRQGWCWFAVIPEPMPGTLASATATDLDGRPAGVLAAWPAGRKPVRDAVRMAAGIVDAGGAEAWASLVLVPRDRAPLFDDTAVSGALRAVLAGPPPVGFSTLVRDSSHFAGAITLFRDVDRSSFLGDPFRRIHPATVLRVGPGMFGSAPPPIGPVIQRYSGQPWPVAGF